MKLLWNIFIGEKNRKYINKYLILIVIFNVLSYTASELFKRDTMTMQSIFEILVITLLVLFIGFRLWVKIYEGTQKLWEKILG